MYLVKYNNNPFWKINKRLYVKFQFCGFQLNLIPSAAKLSLSPYPPSGSVLTAFRGQWSGPSFPPGPQRAGVCVGCSGLTELCCPISFLVFHPPHFLAHRGIDWEWRSVRQRYEAILHNPMRDFSWVCLATQLSLRCGPAPGLLSQVGVSLWGLAPGSSGAVEMTSGILPAFPWTPRRRWGSEKPQQFNWLQAGGSSVSSSFSVGNAFSHTAHWEALRKNICNTR